MVREIRGYNRGGNALQYIQAFDSAKTTLKRSLFIPWSSPFKEHSNNTTCTSAQPTARRRDGLTKPPPNRPPDPEKSARHPTHGPKPPARLDPDELNPDWNPDIANDNSDTSSIASDNDSDNDDIDPSPQSAQPTNQPTTQPTDQPTIQTTTQPTTQSNLNHPISYQPRYGRPTHHPRKAEKIHPNL